MGAKLMGADLKILGIVLGTVGGAPKRSPFGTDASSRSARQAKKKRSDMHAA
jgi:hypothetical protein